MTILVRAAAFAAAFTLVAVPRLNAQSSKITVTIGSGPHAGTYEKTDRCEMNPNDFPHFAIFMMAYTVGAVKPNSPDVMQFYAASGKGKPDGFVVSVTFRGEVGVQPRYQIQTIPSELYPPQQGLSISGRGSVTVRETATGKTASFRGVTKDGVRMEGGVDCRTRSP